MSDLNNNNNDEIDLIDLIAVLVRYRKFILGTLLVSAVLTIAAFFVLPGLKAKQSNTGYSTSVVVDFYVLPDLLKIIDAKTLQNYMSQLSSDPEIIFNALKASGLKNYGGIDLSAKDESSQFSAVKNMLASNQDFISAAVTDLSEELTVKMPDNFNYSLFIKSMLEQMNSHMLTLLKPSAMGIIWEFENITLKDLKPAGLDANVFKNYDNYAAAKQFTANDEASCFVMAQAPFVTKVGNITSRSSILKKGIIVSFAAVFLSIFLSFLFNWIEIVKQDPEAMEKLRKAKSGKN